MRFNVIFSIFEYLLKHVFTLLENIENSKSSVDIYIDVYTCIYIYIIIEQQTAAAAVAAAAPRPARSTARRAGQARAPPTGLVGTPLLPPLLLPLYVVLCYIYIYYTTAKKLIHFLRKYDLLSES